MTKIIFLLMSGYFAFAAISMFNMDHILGGLFASLVSGLIFFGVINYTIQVQESKKKREDERNQEESSLNNAIIETKKLIKEQWKIKIFEINSQLYSFALSIPLNFKQFNQPVLIV